LTLVQPTLNTSTNTVTIDCSAGNYFKYTANGTATITRTPRVIGTSSLGVGAVSSMTLTLPTGMADGDVVVVSVGSDGTQATLPSGWTNILALNVGTEFTRTFYKVMGATPDTSVAISGISTAAAAVSIAIRNVAPGSLIQNSATGSTLNPNPPSLSSVTENSIVLAIGLMDDDLVAASVAAPSGYELVESVQATAAGQTVMLAYRIAETAGTYDPGAFTSTGDDEWVALTVAIPPTTENVGTFVDFTNVPSGAYQCTHEVTVVNTGTLGAIRFPNTDVLFDENRAFNSNQGEAGERILFETTTSNSGTYWMLPQISRFVTP
jgi:hypothetical protein